jgi:hypothetical protein
MDISSNQIQTLALSSPQNALMTPHRSLSPFSIESHGSYIASRSIGSANGAIYGHSNVIFQSSSHEDGVRSVKRARASKPKVKSGCNTCRVRFLAGAIQL